MCSSDPWRTLYSDRSYLCLIEKHPWTNANTTVLLATATCYLTWCMVLYVRQNAMIKPRNRQQPQRRTWRGNQRKHMLLCTLFKTNCYTGHPVGYFAAAFIVSSNVAHVNERILCQNKRIQNQKMKLAVVATNAYFFLFVRSKIPILLCAGFKIGRASCRERV